MGKPLAGTARPLKKVTDNGCSVLHTTEAWVCPKTAWRQRDGMANPPIRAKHQLNWPLGRCTSGAVAALSAI